MAPSRNDVCKAARVLQDTLDEIRCPFTFMGGLGLLLHGLAVDRDIEDIQIALDEETDVEAVLAQLQEANDQYADNRLSLSE